MCVRCDEKKKTIISQSPAIIKRSHSWDRRRRYLFGREETNKIRNPSISAHEDDVIRRTGAELERSVTHGRHVDSAKSSQHDISKLPLMICDWQTRHTRKLFKGFFLLFYFLFSFFVFFLPLIQSYWLIWLRDTRTDAAVAAVRRVRVSSSVLKGRGRTWMLDV